MAGRVYNLNRKHKEITVVFLNFALLDLNDEKLEDKVTNTVTNVSFSNIPTVCTERVCVRKYRIHTISPKINQST